MTRTANIICFAIALGACLLGGAIPAAGVDFAYQGGTLWGHMADAVVDGKHMFCAMHHGLMILDITDPATPNLVSQYALPFGDGTSISIEGNYVYMAGDYAPLGASASGMMIFDVSDITSPQLLAQFPVDGHAVSLSILGSTAFICDLYNGVYIVDISDPANPTELGFFPISTISGDEKCVARGNYLYVANWWDFRILDVTDPANPLEIGNYTAPDHVYDLAVGESVACLAASDSGLVILNISDPATPTEVSRVSSDSTRVWSVAVVGDLVYAGRGDWQNGYAFDIFDVSDPTQPFLVDEVPTEGQVLRETSGRLFVTNNYSTYDLFDVSSPGEPQLLSAKSIPYYGYAGYGQEIATDGRYVYIAGGNMGLVIVDNADPSAPAVVSEGIDNGRCFDLELRDRNIYLIDDGDYYTSGLKIVDVSDPGNPGLVGALQFGSCNKIALSRNYAFIGGNAPTNYIVDISNPTRPVEIGTIYIPGITRGFAIQGHYWYIGYDFGMVIVDISDAANPSIVDTLTAGSPYEEMLMYKGYLLAATTTGVQVLDVATDPSSPTPISFCPCRADDIKPYGNYLFVGNNLGVTIVDMDTPESPEIIGSLQQGFSATAVAPFYNGIAAYNPDGMSIFQVDMPACCNLPGDANYDLDTDLADVVYIINMIFKNGPPLLCPASGDANGDCSFDIGDAVHLVDYIFKSGDAPVSPQCP